MSSATTTESYDERRSSNRTESVACVQKCHRRQRLRLTEEERKKEPLLITIMAALRQEKGEE
jgi:hypothetical protein